MRALNFLGLVVFAAVFGVAVTQSAPNGTPFVFTPPYAFEFGKLLDYGIGLAFAFFFSLFFFGVTAPLVLGVEGAKFATMYLSHGLTPDLLFIFPELLASFAAVNLGVALLADLEDRQPFERNVQDGAVQAFLALGLFVVFALAKLYVFAPA